ncbi:MAG: hypothetical protein L3J08_08360 [Flavobacteriaceae bacterium]|nr:hypothetical protein [Flavobacteriaceae bacterium]
MRKYILYSIIIFSFFSCKNKNKEDNAVARVNNFYLYEEEITEKMFSNFTKEDSLLFRSNYINSWALEKILLDKARINIEDKNSDIKKLVASYEKELLIDRYKQAILQQELDTIITNQDIDKHYKKNKNIYKLNEKLIQLKYVNYNKDINNERKVIKLFKSKSSENIRELIKKELEFNSFNFNDSIWVSLKSVLRKLPILKDIKNIKKNDFIKKEDSLEVYLVAVNDILRRNQIAPKKYILPRIKQMILHKRKLKLIQEIEKSLITDAINKKQFEQY